MPKVQKAKQSVTPYERSDTRLEPITEHDDETNAADEESDDDMVVSTKGTATIIAPDGSEIRGGASEVPITIGNVMEKNYQVSLTPYPWIYKQTQDTGAVQIYTACPWCGIPATSMKAYQKVGTLSCPNDHQHMAGFSLDMTALTHLTGKQLLNLENIPEGTYITTKKGKVFGPKNQDDLPMDKRIPLLLCKECEGSRIGFQLSPQWQDTFGQGSFRCGLPQLHVTRDKEACRAMTAKFADLSNYINSIESPNPKYGKFKCAEGLACAWLRLPQYLASIKPVAQKTSAFGIKKEAKNGIEAGPKQSLVRHEID